MYVPVCPFQTLKIMPPPKHLSQPAQVRSDFVKLYKQLTNKYHHLPPWSTVVSWQRQLSLLDLVGSHSPRYPYPWLYILYNKCCLLHFLLVIRIILQLSFQGCSRSPLHFCIFSASLLLGCCSEQVWAWPEWSPLLGCNLSWYSTHLSIHQTSLHLSVMPLKSSRPLCLLFSLNHF